MLVLQSFPATWYAVAVVVETPIMADKVARDQGSGCGGGPYRQLVGAHLPPMDRGT